MTVIEYSAIGVGADGHHVYDQVWTDLDIRSDGHPSVESAKERAQGMFDPEGRVTRVLIRESVQEFLGGSWKAGRQVAVVERRQAREVRTAGE